MAAMVPDEGKIEWAKRALYATSGSEDLSLRLFRNNITPAETDTTATYTVATFTGYSNQTLTSSQSGSTWSVPTTSANIASSTYGSSAITWTATTDQTIYGYYIVSATGGKTMLSEAFGAGKPLVGASSDTLSITPKIRFGHL